MSKDNRDPENTKGGYGPSSEELERQKAAEQQDPKAPGPGQGTRGGGGKP
jgi:hypothetical protein